MRTPTIESIEYVPENPPEDTKDLQRYLQSELGRISSAISLVGKGAAEKTHVAPPRPRQGMLRMADGTNWNPNSTGEGVYAYLSGGWSKLAVATLGTSTPVISATGATFATPTLETCSYTKINDVCFFELDIDLATSGNTLSANDLQIFLPFVSKSTNHGIFVRYWSNLATAVVGINGALTASSNVLKLRYITSSGTSPWTVMKANDLSATAGSQLRISGFYFV